MQDNRLGEAGAEWKQVALNQKKEASNHEASLL
jgi:hypothetical protein